MKVKNFMKKAIAFCLGLAMTAGVGYGIAGNRASEVDAEIGDISYVSGGTNAESVCIRPSGSSSTTKNGIKLGTGSKSGNKEITVVANSNKLVGYASAWKGATTSKLKFSTDQSGVTLNPTTIDLNADDGISSNSPFTLTKNDIHDSSFKFEILLSGVTVDTNIKIETGGNYRACFWDLYTEIPDPDSISLAKDESVSLVQGNSSSPISFTAKGSGALGYEKTEGTDVATMEFSTNQVTVKAKSDVTGKGTYVLKKGSVESAQTITVVVTAPKSLQEIKITSDLHRTFIVGDTFAGEEVTAYYNGANPEVVQATYSGYDMSSAGNQTVTASYTEGTTKTATYPITVNKGNLAKPTLELDGKTIKWENDPHATKYQAKVGTGEFKDATSPLDVSDYAGAGQKTVSVKAIGNDNYNDSEVATIVIDIPEQSTYELVSDASTLTSGDKLLIVGVASGTYYSLAPYVSGNNCKRNEIPAPTDGKIPTDVANITLGGSAGEWTLFDGTYYLYAAGGTGNNNYLKGAANANNDNAKWTISIDENGEAIIKTKDSTVARHTIMHNTSSSLFSCYASGYGAVSIYKLKSTAKTAALSAANLVDIVGKHNTTIKLTTQNMPSVTANDVSVEYKDAVAESYTSTSEIVSASVGAFNNQESTITITFKKAGATSVQFTVAGTVSDPQVLSVTSYNTPASIDVAGGPEFEIETLNDSEASKKSISPNVNIKDSDGNLIVGQEVSWRRELKLIGDTDEKCITISDNDRVKTIYGNNLGLEGSIKITYTAIINEVVYADVNTEINVKACLDYVDHEVTATFKGNLTADQGDTLNPSLVFDSTEGKTHFGKTTSVPLNTFMYSYTDDRETATNEFKFSTTQSTIYVFHEYDEEYSDSFEITVTPKTVLVERIDINGLTRDDTTGKYLVNVNRGKSYTIAGVAWPENNTENLPINYNMPQGYEGDCTLQGNVFTASNLIGESVEITLSHNGENKASSKLDITISREEQRITVNEPLSWELVEEDLEDWEGDYLVATSVDDNNKIKVADFSSFGSTSDSIGYNEISVSDGVPQNVDLNDVIHVESSTTEGKYKVSANGYYIGRNNNSNGFDKSAVTQEYITTLDNSISYDNAKSLIKGNGGRCLTFLASNSNFRYYSESNNSLQLYKKIGGPTSIVITDGLFNAVMNANNILGFIDADPNTLAYPTNWSTILACFSGIDETIKSSAQYGTGQLNEVEQFFKAYDVLVAKYNLPDSFGRGVEKTNYTIIWKVKGLEDVVQTEKLYGDKLLPPTVVAPKGYEFTGWSPAITPDSIVTGDQTYVAQFEQLTALHVYYETNGGGSIIDHNNYYRGDVVNLANGPQKTGYVFNYWELNGEPYQDSTYTMEETDVTFVASWSLGEYSISYEYAGGSAVGQNPTTYTIESEAIVLNPAYKEGFDFIGWNTKEDGSGDYISVIPAGTHENISLYAQYRTFDQLKVSTEATFTATADASGNITSINSTKIYIDLRISASYKEYLDSQGCDYSLKLSMGGNEFVYDSSKFQIKEYSDGVYFELLMNIPKDKESWNAKFEISLIANDGDDFFMETNAVSVSYMDTVQEMYDAREEMGLSDLQIKVLLEILKSKSAE